MRPPGHMLALGWEGHGSGPGFVPNHPPSMEKQFLNSLARRAYDKTKSLISGCVNAICAVIRASGGAGALLSQAIRVPCVPSQQKAKAQARKAKSPHRYGLLIGQSVFGCGDLQPELEAPANQVVANPAAATRVKLPFLCAHLILISISLRRMRRLGCA